MKRLLMLPLVILMMGAGTATMPATAPATQPKPVELTAIWAKMPAALKPKAGEEAAMREKRGDWLLAEAEGKAVVVKMKISDSRPTGINGSINVASQYDIVAVALASPPEKKVYAGDSVTVTGKLGKVAWGYTNSVHNLDLYLTDCTLVAAK